MPHLEILEQHYRVTQSTFPRGIFIGSEVIADITAALGLSRA